jgi:tetratricopeptide (TPR) repeat protein
MGQAGDYEALIRELLVGVAGGWSYGHVTLWLWDVDEKELTLWLRKFAEGLSPERDRDFIEQLKLLGKMTPGKLASEALTIVARLDRSDEPNSKFLNHEAWFFTGLDFREQGTYKETIEIKPDYSEAWYNRGNALLDLGRYEEAIASYDRAIEIKSDDHQSCCNRGIALGALGRYDEAIASYDQAIEIKPNKHKAWSGRGNALDTLCRYEEAIASYDRAIEINPDDHAAWYNRGNALDDLGRYQEAIASYDQAIKINPDLHEAWSGRGIALRDLGRDEEAIASYDQAIELNPDDDKDWSNRGIALVDLGRYPEAVASYDRAIELNPDTHEAWYNRGLAVGLRDDSYQAAVDAYRKAFKHIRPEIHPEGWGFLQRQIGRTYYDEGNDQLLNYRRDDPHIYYCQALTRYKEALTTLTRAQFPKLRIETLIDTAKVYLAQKNIPSASDCQTEALTIWQDLINAQPSPQGKKRLYLEYSYLLRTQVDLSILDGEPIRALEIAEFDKNKHLEWFLYAQEQQGKTANLLLAEIEQLRLNVVGLQYPQMRQLLAPNRAIIYWHLSPDNITTFILHPHHPNPQVLTNSSQKLREWLETYDTDKLEAANWQELGDILQISEINPHLDGIEHLILNPHRDLHRLPLHTYWQDLTTTYLPSIQIGLNLQAKPQPDLSAGFLLIESPDYSQPTKLKNITKTFGLLTNPEIESAIIAHLFQPKTIIPTGSVKKEDLCAAFNTPHTYGHFNGHAYHDPRRPQDSSLVIDGDELTCQDLAHIDLTPYYLISLSACETGITTHQSIETEYVGLVSAFLSRGTNYVVSTLWSVKDLPSSLLMMAFYMYIKKGVPAPRALHQAAHWLKNLTYAKEAEFHENIYQWLPMGCSSTKGGIKSNQDIAEKAAQENPTAKPYSNPYYWAAFTISGWG